MLETCWGLEVGVAPDDLDNVAEHKDKGHAADEVADEGKSREGACGDAAHGCHGVAVLVVSDHAGDYAPRKGARHQRDADNAAQEGSGKRQTSDGDNQQQDGGDDSDRAQKTAHPQWRGALVEYAGGTGSRTRKGELEQQGDKAGRQGRGHDAADDIVNRRGGTFVFGAVDLERTDLGSCGALGVLGYMGVHRAGDAGVFTQDELVGPDLDIAIDGAVDGYRTARECCRLGGAAQGNRLAHRVKTVGGATGVEHDVLTGYRHAAIDCCFGDIDGTRRQANGSAYSAVANRQALACRDNIAADGSVV